MNSESTDVMALLDALKEARAALGRTEKAVRELMDFGERGCPFCGHHHKHDPDCVYWDVCYALNGEGDHA